MARAVSSVVEHLVYTERVGGSKPSPPTFLFRSIRLRSGQVLRFAIFDCESRIESSFPLDSNEHEFTNLFSLARCSSFLSRIRNARFFNGSVRKTERAKSGCATTENRAFAEVSRNANTKRTPGGKTGRCGSTTRDQKGSTPTLATATAG